MERIRRDLNQAAIAGDVNALAGLLQQDPLLLDRITVDSTLGAVEENPLHIAALLGHLDFVRKVMNHKPDLAHELNSSHGSSPLHLASAKGHLEIVREILRMDQGLCLISDHEGRIPLHIATMKGKVEVMNEFIQTKPELTQELTGRGETILHLSVKYNQFEALNKIIEEDDGVEELLKAKDGDGNTVLHLAVARRQIQAYESPSSASGLLWYLLHRKLAEKWLQILKRLLGSNRLEVNTLNGNGLTALDVLLQCPAQSGDLEIGEMLRNAGALRGATANTYVSIETSQRSIRNENINNKKKKKCKDKKVDGGGRDVSGLMVVAILIATMTFEAGLNPPGGDCAKLNANCTITQENFIGNNMTWTYSIQHINYSSFLVVDMIGFLSSLSVIVLIISGLRYKRVLMVIMMIAIASVSLLFPSWMQAMKPRDLVSVMPTLWLVTIIGLFSLWQFVRFVIWLLKKCGVIKGNRERARTRS